MHEDLQRFFAHPGPRNYLRVRERLYSRRRRARAEQLVELVTLFSAARYAAVRGQIDTMMPAWALSPAVYWIGACAALETGDNPAAELDRFLYQCCLQGILATGHGDAARPLRITYSSDIDEVLYRKGLAREQMTLERGKQGLCDVALCTTGEQVWFSWGEGRRDPAALDTLPRRIAHSFVR